MRGRTIGSSPSARADGERVNYESDHHPGAIALLSPSTVPEVVLRAVRRHGAVLDVADRCGYGVDGGC